MTDKEFPDFNKKETKDISNETFLENLKKNKATDYTEDNEEYIKKEYKTISDSYKSALDLFNNANFPQAIKVFKELAIDIQFLYDSLKEKKGDGDFSERNSLNDLTGKQWLRHTKSWHVFDGKSSDIPKEIKDHPGSFPPEMVKFFIEFFTKEGGWVFDPFMGIGSTAVACQDINRNCWGTEINPKYYSYAINRVKSKQDKKNYDAKIFNQDCMNLLHIKEENHLPEIDFCITSPPYWNILGTSRGGVKSVQKKRIEEGLDEKYSESKLDLGNINNYDDYLNVLEDLFKKIYEILKENGYLMIIIQNVRPKDGIMVPIAWDIGKKLSKTYTLRQEFMWCQDQKFLGIWGYPTTYVSNVHHHYCLVFQKKSEKK